MADSILKLRVESSEYDAKLKKAAEGIQHLAEVAHRGGGELTGLEKAELDYVKALGEMETRSRTAAGSVRELENTYKELKVVYDQLNDVEKADEGGKALAASLEQIKTRAQEARTQLENASKSLSNNGQEAQQSSSALDALASKFTINIDALKLFNIGLQAAKGALDVAKDAFLASESNIDEWEQTVRSAEGIYQSFLQSLNTGNFSSFLSNIGQVTQAAREAFNALDELGTRMTIINPERARLQARQQELRADIRRNGADSEVGKAALAELKKIEPLLSKSFKTESQMNYTAFEKLVRERLAVGGINLNQKSFREFMKTFSNDDAFQNLRRNARGSVTTEMSNAYNPNAAITRRTVDTRNIEQKLLDLFTDEWRQANSGYLTASFSAQGAAASNALGNARYMKAGGTKGGNGGKDTKTEQTELQQNQSKINALTQEYVKLGDKSTEAARERQAEIQKEIELLQLRNGLLGLRAEQAQGRLTLGAGDFQRDGLSNTPGPLLKAPDTTIPRGGLQLSDKQMKAVNKSISGVSSMADGIDKSFTSAASAVSALGSAFASIEDPAAKVIGTVSQAIATIALGYATATTQAATMGPWAWIAFAATGLATMISTISAIHSSTGYANGGMIDSGHSPSFLSFSKAAPAFATGGIIPMFAGGGTIPASHAPTFVSFAKSAASRFASGGTIPHAANGYFVGGSHYSGDVTPIMANAGELVLNKAQQGVLANELQGGGIQNLNLTATIKGEQIRLALNNNGRRTGRGEYVQSNKR